MDATRSPARHRRVHRYFRWGVLAGPGVMAIGALMIVVGIALKYDGQCGGLLPFLAGAHPCSRWEYLSGAVAFTAGVAWDAYWPLLLAMLVMPPVVGHLLDRRAGHA